LNFLTLGQVVEPGALDGRDVHECVGPAALGLDESVALGAVEPFDGSGIQDGVLTIAGLTRFAPGVAPRHETVSTFRELNSASLNGNGIDP
jgi:hypothetical protein